MKPERWYVVVLFFVALLSSACSVVDSGIEPTPTQPPISNLSIDQIKSEISDCVISNNGGCTSEQQRAILAQHVGKRVRWSGSILEQDGYSLLMRSDRLMNVMLLNLHDVDFSNYKIGQVLTFEGTIIIDPNPVPGRVWALDDVEIDPIVGIDTPQPETAIENVNLEVTSVYKITFNLNNTSGQPVETCFFVSLSFDDNGYYRLLQNEKNDDKCVNTVPVGQSTYTFRLGPVKSDEEYVGELEIELRALKDNDIVVWDSWGSIARHTEVIQVQEYAYNPDIVVKIDSYELNKVGNRIKFRLEMHNWSGFDVTTCIRISVSPVNSDEVIELAELKGSCLVTLTDRDQAISYDLGVQDFRYADVVITVLTEDESAVIEEWTPDNVYVWD